MLLALKTHKRYFQLITFLSPSPSWIVPFSCIRTMNSSIREEGVSKEICGTVRPLMSRIDLVSKNLLANCFCNFSKKDWKNTAISEKYRRNRKCRKSKKNVSCYVKRLSNKYGKNSRNNKFFKILLLQREKAKKGFVKSANFAKIAQVTGIFLTKWKDWVTNVAKIARITNLTKYYT